MKSTSIQLPASQVSKKSQFLNWLMSENATFSAFMEEPISNQQTILIGQAVLSFAILATCTFFSIFAMLVCMTWFITSLHLCKKGGLK